MLITAVTSVVHM